MCSMSVLCPLCAQTSFSSIDALRCSLIKAANGPLACPICHEMFLGLDKLTIHLFSHTNIMNSANNAASTTATTKNTPDNQSVKNIEKIKTQEIENLNNINSSGSNDNKITTQTHLKNEVSFENLPHPHQQQLIEKNMMIKKAKVAVKAEKKIINKTVTSQHQQVVTNDRNQEKMGTSENLAQCDICEFTFRNEELKNMHVRLVHQNIECHANPKVNLSGNSLSAISLRENNGDFKCHLCSKTFKMKGSLRVHLKVVHLMGLPYVNNSPKLSICDRIRLKEEKTIKSVAQLPSETQNVVSPTLNVKSTPTTNNNIFNMQPVNFITNFNTLTPSSNASVMNCHQQFQQNNHDNSVLQNSNILLVFNSTEMAQHSNLSSNSDKFDVNSSTTAPVIATDREDCLKLFSGTSSVTENPKIWECDVCSKAFTTKYFLKKHKRLHTGEMPYTCELCARTFTFQQSYHKHLLYHSDEKPHVCSTCGRAFKELSTLHNHERIHSGEKPFKCEVCGKSFRQRVSFLVHTRIHTGVMPYKCEICQRSFRYKVSQRTHKCQSLPAEESPTPNEENTIEQMSENFIKAFLETSIANPADSHLNQSHNSPASNEIAVINEKATSLNEQQALLTKTIDDIVVESCNKMGIGSDGFAAEQIVNENSMSPTQKLQNMRLYSPQLVTPDLSVIEGDLTRFFLENSQSENNIL